MVDILIFCKHIHGVLEFAHVYLLMYIYYVAKWILFFKYFRYNANGMTLQFE